MTITAIQALESCGLKEGERLLILGGAGGVGTAAIQIAKNHFKASEVIVTASAGKSAALLALGADRVIDHRTQDFIKLLSSEDAKVDRVLDTCGEAAKAFHVLRDTGGGVTSICSGPTYKALSDWSAACNLHGGVSVNPIVAFALNKAGCVVDMVGETGYLKGLAQRKLASFTHIIAVPNEGVMKTIHNLLESGSLKAVIDSVFPFEQALDAVAR